MPLDTHLEIATVYDTARALTAAIEHERALVGRVFNLAGGASCRTTYREFLARMFKIYGLQIKFLHEVAFARRNFHCGYFKDSDELERILHFRKNSLEDYYRIVDRNTNKLVRFSARVFSRPIIYFLTRKSEPLQARKQHNQQLIERFFGRKEK